ncbi:MAG TPA: hypothetical protein P5186_28150 [Candidatus Paceibacterota bacterium]|nr:hypothetical protein [Candidatus Paceibacterota bacterium]
MKKAFSLALFGIAAGVLALAAPVNAGTFNANFDNSQVPTESQVFGNSDGSWLPMVEAGGVGNTPCLKLTKNVNSQYGSFVIDDLDGGANVYGIRASFMARVGGGTSIPADGWSFCVAPDLPDGTWGETGAGTGLTIQFDTYDNVDADPNNSTGEAPQIRVVIGGQTVASTPVLPLSDLINNAFVPVEIKLNADGSLDVTYNGKAHFSKLFFPGYQPLAGARVGIGARTGGLNANHFLDDLSIETYTVPQPGIVRQPQSQRVLEGTTASFVIALNNGDGATVQWLRNGTVIPGATETNYTLNAVTSADTEAKFSARITLGATTITSEEATLTVVQIDLPATPVVSYNFNDGLVPAEALVYGSGVASDGFSDWLPYVSPNGGVGDSGVLLITESFNDQSGAFIIPDQHAGGPVYGVAARFDVRIGGGSEVPADGMSFNFAADLPDGTVAGVEEGVGSGLRVCFDIYDNTDGNPNNATGEAPAITLKWGTTVVSETKTALSDITTGDAFADVIVRLTADGKLDVAWNGKVLLYRATVPGFGSIANGRFGFFARTGGLNANQWIDNLRLYTYLTAPLRVSKEPANQTVLVGKRASFNVEVSTPSGATYQWFRDGVAIPGATASTYTTPATTPADNGANFKAEVKLGAETVVSSEAVLSVLDLAAPTAPQLSYNFNNGVPAGADIGGSYPEGTTPVAFVDSSGGVNDSGTLKLTTSENSQAGGFRSPVIEEGAQLLEFTFAADVLAGNGTATPADGFSINLANDLPITAPGDAENGTGSGITIAFDTYDNDDADPNNETGEAPSIDVRYKGQVVAARRVPLALLNSGVFATVLLRVKENGVLDLAVGDTVIYQGLLVPGYVPMSGARLALYGRTGGANASYWFDNVRLGYTIPSTVEITGEPADALVLVGQTATFQVLVSNPQGVTYQWQRNGVDIPGATQATYTTPVLAAADDGAGYAVVVKGPGNTVTSRTAIASVMAPFDTGTNPAVDIDFNNGTVPADGAIFGNAVVQFSGGVSDTGFLQLTEAVNDQSSSFLLNTPAGSAPIKDFTATWMMRVGGGTATPADGCSFILGTDIGDGAFGEDGAGAGLVVSFDTYDNGTTEVAPEISIRYQSTDVATRPFDINVLRTGDVFEPIGVRVNRNGTLDLYYGDTAVYRGLPLPGYTPFDAGRFGWGARTGGLNDNHWVDDIKIALNIQPDAGPTLTISRSGENVVITWTGGGTLQTTIALPGVWSDIPGATSGYTTPATDSARYFRVRQF